MVGGGVACCGWNTPPGCPGQQAGAAARKLGERNRKIIADLRLYGALAVLIHILGRIVLRWSSWSLGMAVRFALVAGINLFLQWQMESLAASGTDLAQEGTLLSYYYDTIYIGWFVMVTVCVSDSFYWAYLAVPLFAAYKLSKLASSLFGLATGGSSAGTADTNGSAKTAKASSKPAAKARKPAAGAR